MRQRRITPPPPCRRAGAVNHTGRVRGRGYGSPHAAAIGRRTPTRQPDREGHSAHPDTIDAGAERGTASGTQVTVVRSRLRAGERRHGLDRRRHRRRRDARTSCAGPRGTAIATPPPGLAAAQRLPSFLTFIHL